MRAARAWAPRCDSPRARRRRAHSSRPRPRSRNAAPSRTRQNPGWSVPAQAAPARRRQGTASFCAGNARSSFAESAAHIPGSAMHAEHPPTRADPQAARLRPHPSALAAHLLQAPPLPSAPDFRPCCSRPAPPACHHARSPTQARPSRPSTARNDTATAKVHPSSRSCACSSAARCSPPPTACSHCRRCTASATNLPAHAPAPPSAPPDPHLRHSPQPAL